MAPNMEPNGELPCVDDEAHAIVMLAMGVFAQAFRDLTVQSGVHDLSACRRDAYDFLTIRVWEPECLWGEILAPYLIRRKVLEIVHRRLTTPFPFSRPHP